MKQLSCRKLKSQDGFTLVEVALIVLVMGLFVGAIFSFLTIGDQQTRTALTLDRQKKIAAALSRYAVVNGRLPCPANPNLSDAGAEKATCNNAFAESDRVGVVPFYTLGLSQQDATDGFGNPFTYSVSMSARYPEVNQLNDACRSVAWRPAGANINPRKAEFCCTYAPFNPSNLVVDPAILVMAPSDVVATQGPAAWTGGANDPPSGSVGLTTYMAYVLVSHGPNGARSFVWGNALRKTGAISNVEFENADNTRGFVTAPFSTQTADYFDDIVMWRTQEQVVSELGNDSCFTP